MTSRVDQLPHYVYRYFGADDTVLYVGCTYDLKARHKRHTISSEWFPDAVRRSHQEFPDKWTGRVAERVAIIMCRPVHNKTHNYWTIEFSLARELHSVMANRPDNAAELIADIEARAIEDGKRQQRVRDAYVAKFSQEAYERGLAMGLTPQSARHWAKRRACSA